MDDRLSRRRGNDGGNAGARRLCVRRMVCFARLFGFRVYRGQDRFRGHHGLRALVRSKDVHRYFHRLPRRRECGNGSLLQGYRIRHITCVPGARRRRRVRIRELYRFRQKRGKRNDRHRCHRGGGRGIRSHERPGGRRKLYDQDVDRDIRRAARRKRMGRGVHRIRKLGRARNLRSRRDQLRRQSRKRLVLCVYRSVRNDSHRGRGARTGDTVYPGHDAATTLGYERKYNPFR